jgi:hypothetical protein
MQNEIFCTAKIRIVGARTHFLPPYVHTTINAFASSVCLSVRERVSLKTTPKPPILKLDALEPRDVNLFADKRVLCFA